MSKSRVTCEDIIALEKPRMATISENGDKVAYIVQKSDYKKNDVTDHLYVYDQNNQETQSTIALDRIRQISWRQDKCHVLGRRENNHVILSIDGTTVKEIVSSTDELSNFAVSLDGDKIYYGKLVKTSEEKLQKDREEGHEIDDGIDDTANIMDQDYQHYEFEEIWVKNQTNNSDKLITKFSWDNWTEWKPEVTPLSVSLSLSPTGQYLAVPLNRLGRPKLGEVMFQRDLCIIDINTGKTTKLQEDAISPKTAPCWISDHELVFMQSNYNLDTTKNTLYVYNVLNNSYTPLPEFIHEGGIKAISWHHESSTLYIEAKSKIIKFSLLTRTMSDLNLPDEISNPMFLESSCTASRTFTQFASVIESRSQLAQVVHFDSTTQSRTVITKLNSNVNNLLLGKIEPVEYQISKKNGRVISANGFLLHPVGEINDEKYPLIVATYGFYASAHAINPEGWHTSFPAQVFANQGYYVLLLNTPPFCGAQTNRITPEESRDELGWNMLRVFEHAVSTLTSKHNIDPQKVGIYGWSHGGFVVEFAISHSNVFKVASLGDGGGYTPAAYWASGNQAVMDSGDTIFGGPPWEKENLQAYIEFSPFYSIKKINSPLLIEAVRGTFFLEMYHPLRREKVPAVLTLYPGEDHNFVKPKARLASMNRKLDWFNFWFYDRRNPDKMEQYEKWERKRQIWEESRQGQKPL